ncbi:MAG: glycosyltransferase family 4 protein [Bacteroidales bacterium]|nr:glycosyltransferase family 4 protein [Bacteroidales bacterium]
MVLTYIIIAVILLVAELIYFKIADHFNIIDKPNERSSHSTIVLRGGGIIFVVSVIVWVIWQMGQGEWMAVQGYLPFVVGLVLITGVSFIDDIRSLPDSLRLVIQFSSMFLMFYSWGILNWDSWWMIIPGLILCVGITNAYNFMDGINGINGGYTLALLMPLLAENCKLEAEGGEGFVNESLIVVVLLADLVFCFFNYRPKGRAKCFAGDVGSVGAAFIVLFALGRLILTTGDFTYIVFLVVYGVDSVLTICHRIMLHENLGEAHRKHAYQLMANELGLEHIVVSTIYMVLQLAISVGMILIPDTVAWHWGYFVCACLVLGVAYLLFMKKYYHLHEEYLASLKR